MTRAVRITLGLIVGIGVSAAPLPAQITGPEVSRKVAKVPKVPVEGVLDSLGAGLEWLSWTDDEAVARLIYEPIKLLGLERFGSQAGALKGVVLRAETLIRATVNALGAGEMETVAAMRSMDQAVNEFRSAVGELLEAS